jgi:type IV secretory pathway VirB10-like protein
MADPVPGTAPVVDQRMPPRGVMPRSTQMWVMVGLALLILAIIMIAGRPEPPKRPNSVTATAAVPPFSPERLRDYQDRLRLLETRARQEAPASPATSTTTQVDPDERERTTAAPDPLAEDRRRRNYESLFASNVIMSRRPDGQRLVAEQRNVSRSLERSSDETPPAPPNIDAVADAVVRATTRYAPAVASPLPASASDAASQSSVALSSTATTATAAHTPRISAGGATHRLLEGTVIDAVLANRLDGAGAAPVNCLVTNPVYSHDGQSVVIPAGSRVLGTTKPVQAFGETRIAVAFTRLVLPDGSTYRLDQFVGLNSVGDAGLRDHVNQHYLSTFGAAAAVGLITGLAQYLGTGGLAQGSNNTVVIGGAADATGQATAQTMNRFLNRLPTVTIREGHRVKIYLTSDIELPAYQADARINGSGAAR